MGPEETTIAVSLPTKRYVGPTEFYQATADFRSQHTALYDFIHPMTAAVWNLRWQVDGYARNRPGVTEDELWGRFMRGSGSSDRWKNLHTAFIGTPWEVQQQEIAKYALLGMTSLFEGWVDEIVGVLAATARAREEFSRELQFPPGYTLPARATSKNGQPRGNPHVGALAAMTSLIGVGSPMLTGFRDVLRSPRRALPISEKYSMAELPDLLTVYRYFKEMRNSISHTNAKATVVLADASQQASAIPHVRLRLPKPPNITAYSPGQPVATSISGVIAYSEVLLRLVLTMDTELSIASAGEGELRRRWILKWGQDPRPLGGNLAGHDKAVSWHLYRAGIPIPSTIHPIRQWLLANALIAEPTPSKIRAYEKRSAARQAWLVSGMTRPPSG